MKKLFFIPLFLFFCFNIQAQKVEIKLQKKIEALVKGFNGQIGVYVKSLETGKFASSDCDTVFPSDSLGEVPILIGIMNKIERKELDYHQTVRWADTIGYDSGEDIIAYLKPGTDIELSKVIMLMMTISDNNASLWLQSIAGTGNSINMLMDSLGYSNTKVNSRTPGRELMRSVYGWGQTTPYEMARIMEDIARRKIISVNASERILRIMGRQYWDEEALSAIPADVFVASKSGAVDASRDEVLYVNGKHPYIISIFTKNNKDIGWQYDNEAWVLTRELSRLVWEYYK